MTLSQRGLASHLELDVSTIRRHGDKVIGFARNKADPLQAHQEDWEAVRYLDGRLAHYRLVKSYGE